MAADVAQSQEQGSVLLRSLGRAFRDVLMKDLEGEKDEPKIKEQPKKKAKKDKKDGKEDKKPKKEPEEKQLVREGRNSLITYPNASSFSIFSHIRHFVLQSHLCETYNSRLGVGTGGESESGDENEEEKKDEGTKMPVVVGLGVRGVFIIIQDVWQTMPPLCLRALREFLNILQGQSPAGLCKEPKETTDALFDLLMKMVVEPVPADNQLATDLSSVACSCLLSLVVALGDTGKMLTALSSMITAPSHLTQSTLQIPQIFYSLQDSVKAVLLGCVVDTDWYEKGVPSKSLVEEWRLNLPSEESVERESGDGGGMAVASDGRFLYIHGPFGIAKVGSGYGNTQKGLVYKVELFRPGEKAWLGHAEGKLFYYPLCQGEDTLSVINTETLQVENTLELDADCLGSQCLFSDGESIGQIKVKKEGGCVVRKFATLCSPLAVVEEKSLQLSQKTVLCMGRAKYDSQESIHSLYQDTTDQVVRVMASRNSAAVQTASGKLLYTGSGLVFGITSKDVLKGEWKEVALPDKNVKVEHCACDNAGMFCLVVSDKGAVYFGGLNKKGEGGEPATRGRGQPKPAKLKRVAKLNKQEVCGCACGGHATAMLTRDGKLYMFGSLDDDIVDKSTGAVTDLLGVPASQVAMGRSHTAVLTQHGTVFTFGNNSFGQCGRNYKPPKEKGLPTSVVRIFLRTSTKISIFRRTNPNVLLMPLYLCRQMRANGIEEEGEAEGEKSGSDEDDDEEGIPESMCDDGEHKWAHNVCMVCSFCGFCTGYGPECCNEGLPGREKGKECGCGAGDSGCMVCGTCRVCAGEEQFGFDEDPDEEDFGEGLAFRERMHRVQAAVKKRKEKKKKKERKEGKGGMGLNLLFGGIQHEVSVESGVASSSPGAEEEEQEKEERSTKKPAMVPLLEDMTAMQIDCGTFHTAILLHSGDVYVFGLNKRGQLGQGNSKDCGHPVKVPLPGPAQQVACGDNHTVVLLQSGEVYTFGKHGEGQLGRSASASDSSEGEGKGERDGETWYMSPGPIPSLGDSCKVVWVGARGNQTFVAVNESLVSDQNLGECRVFADLQTIGLIPPQQTPGSKSHLIVINRQELKAKKFDGDNQEELCGRGLCVDPEYDVLWSYSNHPHPTVTCYNPVTTNIKDPSGTILSSSICLPRSKEASTSRSHISLNLLSCLHTLATSPPLTVEVLAGSKMRKYDKDEYLSVMRFNSYGGGWGYSNSSIEAIRFSADADIVLGGFGLYGGRGQYNAEIKLFDLGDEEGGSSEADGTLIASQSESGYTCERQHTYRMLFEKPVLLTADHFYTAVAVISSPSGASSDAGSSGQREVLGPERVTFNFKTSKRSNNGTDVGSGQIPEFLFRLPDLESEKGEELRLLGREFSSTVSPSGLKAVLQLLQWVWQNLSRGDSSLHIQSLSFIAKASLGLLKTYIREVIPEKGKLCRPALDCPEMAEMVYEARTLLQMILSSHSPQGPSDQQPLLTAVTESCCLAFRECFHAFYPSVPLKWFALCQQLQYLDPHDIVSGVPTENLLSTILEALAEPTVSYIGLGYDSTVSLSTVLYNSEPDPRFPILSEFMRTKELEENEGGELLGFNTVASKLLAVVTAPIHSALVSKHEQLQVSPVVRKAGQLLLSRINEVALCIAYPESASFSGIPLRSDKKEKVVESTVRFPEKECGHPQVDVTDTVFSVNRAIQLHGVSVYGGTGESCKYSLSILKGEAVLGCKEGVYSHTDYYADSLVNITLKEPVKLEADVVYTARVQLTGSVYDLGVEGKTNLTGPGGLSFTLHETGAAESNPECGPLVKFLYSLSTSAGPQNVVQLSVHLATTLLEVTVKFLERALGAGLTPPTLQLLGSSFMFSTLLPTTLAQLGPVACRQPRYAVEVLDLVKRTLPIISVATRSVQSEKNSVYSDTKHLHYATVETDHPYKPSSVTHYQVKFSENVQWMTLEIDPRSGFAQREDKIGELLIPRGKNGSNTPPVPDNKQGGQLSELVGLPFDDLFADWERYSLENPPGLVLLPGNEVHISVCTDTEYEKRDGSNHFGLKCQVVGYEWTTLPAECVLFLEKELVALGGMCAASLLKEDTVLPFAEELNATDDKSDTEKADMRIVQAAAQEVLNKHGHVLGHGLMVDTPTVQNILSGDIPLIRDTNEQLFLRDFISCKAETPGGRLARWLQPDRAVDPEASELGLPSDPPLTGLPSEFSVTTRDQDGKMVYVGDMKVEVKAMWLGGKEGGGRRDKIVDAVMGVRKPVFKRQYNATKLNGNSLYHSISMMMPYSDYSFEELRLFAPKVKRSTENMPLKSDGEGSYTATWVPATSGTYLIQVFIDGKHTGQEKQIEVVDREVSQEEEVGVVGEGEGEEEAAKEEAKEEGNKIEEGENEDEEWKLDTQESKEEEEEMTIFKPKMKEFPKTATVVGLRIRAEPSFMADAIGAIKPGDSFCYLEEITNEAGVWVKLDTESLQQLGCFASQGYTLSYNAEKEEQYLIEKEPPPEMIKRVKKTSPLRQSTPKKRVGGPGIYRVVQCGAAGHNIRSKPSMRGTPVGRLSKGNIIEAEEEVENDDGIWLRLCRDSVKKYCDAEVESWTLTVAVSGRVYLAQDGDATFQSQVIDTTTPPAPAQPAFPTAASVFGTPPQKSVFGTPLVPSPPTFQFGTLKLQFGSSPPLPPKPPLFKFGSGKSKDDKKKTELKSADARLPKAAEENKASQRRKFPFFGGRTRVRRKLRSAVVEPSKTPPPKEVEEEDKVSIPETDEVPLPPPAAPGKKALSPAVAECQRAVYAAFLWHEGLVHDAIVSALCLKFNPELSKEMKREQKAEKEERAPEKKGQDGESEKEELECGEGEGEGKEGEDKEEQQVEVAEEEKVDEGSPAALVLSSDPAAQSTSSSPPLLPPTLNHLVTFWDEISTKVLDSSSIPFPPPKVPSLAQELQKRYEEEKKEVEKRKKEKDKKVSPQAGGGSTVCELCDQSFPDPVTYHMKDMHPGCGKHASGWGYNSRGTFCSGWAGNCGDGGRGGSTWYLMCKDCHAKYLAMKNEVRKKTVRAVPLPKMKTKKPGKPRSLPILTAVQGMIQNAKFLLEISCPTDKPATTPTAVQSPSSLAFSKQASFPNRPDQEVKLTEAVLPEQSHPIDRPAFLRSLSVSTANPVAGSKSSEGMPPRRNQNSKVQEERSIARQHTMDSPISTSEQHTMGSLVYKPSINLARLMYNRSKHSSDSKEIGYGKVMAFILQYHDLNGLRMAMKQSMRAAGVRAFAMECLQWLLQKVEEPSIVHDILWQFSAALSDHPVHQTAAKVKAEREKEKKGGQQPVEDDFFLGKHPLASLEGAGCMQLVLRKQFHCLLQTVANKMPNLPMGSAVQRMAMQCWCLHFQSQDHSFLLQSNMFSNISKALSGTDDGDSSGNSEKRAKGNKSIEIVLMENVMSKGKLKVSSNEAMITSLTDDSTETFWESRDEPRGRPRTLTLSFDRECQMFAAAVHIDNQKDSGQRVDSLTLLVGRDEDNLKEVFKHKLSLMHSGWIILLVPTAEQMCTMMKIEVKGPQNNVRVRQLQALASPARKLDSSLTSIAAQQKACEEEALRVFRLLTSQVFGSLLPMKPLEEEEDVEETDAPAPSKEGEKEGEVRDSMADILLAKNKLSSLQKQVCVHVIQSVHTEVERMREEWEAVVAKGPPPKLTRQGSLVEVTVTEGDGRASDTYCYELLSMLIGLSQSEIGCFSLSQQDKLVQDLFSLLHVATSRMQLQALSLLRRILPTIGPKNLAPMLEVLILPPIGYSAIAEAVNSAATLNTLGILDALLAVVAKALSVQVKAKGRGTNVLQALTGDSTISAATLACLAHPKPVPGETSIRNQRWYLRGSINKEVGSEVVMLLKDMTKGGMGSQWQGVSKAAIGQAVLHLTKINEEARVPNPGMYSQTLWLCLAALCVIDEEHAEALSSGQWLGQDGKPKDKPLCDNHDDGETQALILCDHCGNLCGECDRVLHYSKKNKDHQRQVFKEEEEAVKVELHEGCGRIKLYWTMALADYRTLKCLIEFREASSGGSKGACRFCGTVSNTGLLAIGNVCSDPECQERAATVCDKTLACGHACCGVKGEEECLPCLHGCSPPEAKLKQDADDMCMICYTEGLSCAPCVQLKCGHVFHYHCCRNALTKRWSGPMIAFRFMFCSLCVNIPISHPALSDVQEPIAELYEDVKRKCMLRLEYENQIKCDEITSPSSKFYQKPLEYAMSKYAYYLCYKCKKSYYGGEARCAQAAAVSDEYDPSELVCPACSNVGGAAVQVCPKHGTDFLEYKCRYCCSVAVYFCFGTTHFCNPCHDDFQRITSVPKSELPQCPVGPRAKPLEGTECPLHVKHPPTGEEFALGCGVCRNAQTF